MIGNKADPVLNPRYGKISDTARFKSKKEEETPSAATYDVANSIIKVVF